MRQQVYNNAGFTRQQISLASETQRRLSRRINNNIGLLNRSRRSNHSDSVGSLSMRRTQLSTQKLNSSKDRDITTNQFSITSSQDPLLNSHDLQSQKKIGSLFGLNRQNKGTIKVLSIKSNRSGEPNDHRRQKLFYDQGRINKNYVQNVYMLSSEVEQDKYGHKRINLQKQQNIPEPQTPRRLGSPQDLNYQMRDERNGRNPVQKSPSQRSILRSRNSRQKNSRDRIAQSPRRKLERQEGSEGMKKLQKKYLQNLYELNSPKVKQHQKREQARKKMQGFPSQKQLYHLYYLDQKKDEVMLPEASKFAAPQVSRFGVSSQGSLPMHSVTSQRVIPTRRLVNPNSSRSKHSIKLDQPIIESPRLYWREQSSSLSARLIQNNIILKEKDFPHKIGSRKVIEEKKVRQNEKKNHQIEKRNLNLMKLGEQKSKRSDARVLQDFKRLQEQKKKYIEQTKKNQQIRKNHYQQQRRGQQQVKKSHQLIQGSQFLPVQSRGTGVNRELVEDILERIILHLESLNILADYTKDFKKLYDNLQPWQVLIFLSYKKFYIQRMKVLAAIKGQKDGLWQRVQNSPFSLPYSRVTLQELDQFRNSKECSALECEIQNQNDRIRSALRQLYNLYIQKSGDHVNMLQCDNFSEDIYKLMKQQVTAISVNLAQPSVADLTKRRMGQLIKAGLLVAYLQGRYVKNFAQILLHEDVIRVGKRETLREDCICDLFLGEFKRAL